MPRGAIYERGNSYVTVSLFVPYLEVDEVGDVRQLGEELLELGHEVVRGDDDGAARLVHGVQDAVLPQVGVHRAHVDVLRIIYKAHYEI